VLVAELMHPVDDQELEQEPITVSLEHGALRDLDGDVRLARPEPIERVINAKSTAQAQHDREEAKAAGAHERTKDLIRFVVSVVVMLGVGGLALYLTCQARTTEEARWAAGVVGAIVGTALSNIGSSKK
jgi:hypothetical protein